MATIKVRYRRSIIGYLWTVLAPILQYTVIAIVFKAVGRIDDPDFYAKFFSAIMVFTFFSGAVNEAPTVFIANESYIKKVNAPKSVYLLGSVLYHYLNFLLIFATLYVFGLFFLGYH